MKALGGQKKAPEQGRAGAYSTGPSWTGFAVGTEAHPVKATRKTFLGSTCVGATPPQALPYSGPLSYQS
jgi:hypothetical protein